MLGRVAYAGPSAFSQSRQNYIASSIHEKPYGPALHSTVSIVMFSHASPGSNGAPSDHGIARPCGAPRLPVLCRLWVTRAASPG